MPQTHTYTAPNQAVASVDVPDGYAPPDGLSLLKDGAEYPVTFLHDEFDPVDYTPPTTPSTP